MLQKIFLAISSSVLHNYFDSSTRLFSDLYPAQILNLSAKLFFSCINNLQFIFYYPYH